MFLAEYFEYIMKHPDSMLSKIFGIYEVKVGGNTPLSFLISENMLDMDFDRIKRCFDLKGSLHKRIVHIDEGEETGLKVLKDQNFMN